MAEPIFHIAVESEWRDARRAGQYRVSTLDRTLAQVGFIHASRADQWQAIHEQVYGGVTVPLVLLVIDPDRLSSPVREEQVGDQTFPHVYGPLNRDAVIEVRALPRNSVLRALRHEGPELARMIGRDLLGKALVALVIVGCVVLGGLVGQRISPDAGAIAGIFVGLAAGVPVALLLGSRLQQRADR